MYGGDGEAEAEGEEGKDDVKEEEDEGSRRIISGIAFYTAGQLRHKSFMLEAFIQILLSGIFNSDSVVSRPTEKHSKHASRQRRES